MNEVGTFNIKEMKPTNQNIDVVFSPSKNIETYIIDIYKDDKKILETTSTYISLNETGKYKIKVTAILPNNTQKVLESGYYIIDKEPPIIEIKEKKLSINKNQINNIKENVSVTDNNDKNIEVQINNFNPNENNKQIITYTAVDKAGNIAEKNITVKMINNYYFFFICGVITTLILVIIYNLSRYKNSLNITNRIEPFTVKPIKDKSLSISEKIIEKYQSFTKKLSKNFNKSLIAQKYSKKLEKYLPITKIHKTKEDIFAGKIIISFIFASVAIFSKIVTFSFITGYELILIITLGFFVLDIIYFIKYKIFRWKIESDFIAAITIMNNSFKSGRSITQSIDTVANELDGYIGEEFKRMSLELLYGLEIDVVFERFSKRIGLEEANYLTASLTILNKTGGDIIKVFNLIEKNMFDKRKLRLELSSLTSGSRIVVATLLGMPFFFALVISMINKDYFLPLLTTQIGRILLIFMIIYYIIFVVVVRKIMKVVI